MRLISKDTDTGKNYLMRTGNFTTLGDVVSKNVNTSPTILQGRILDSLAYDKYLAKQQAQQKERDIRNAHLAQLKAAVPIPAPVMPIHKSPAKPHTVRYSKQGVRILE